MRMCGVAIALAHVLGYAAANSQTLTFHLMVTPVEGSAYRAIAGDFNHDGNLDLALLVSDAATVQQVPQGNTTLRIFLGVGDGTFRLMQTLPIAQSAIEIASGDLNGDGQVDLVVESETVVAGPETLPPQLTLYLGLPDGTFHVSDRPIPLPAFDVSPAAWAMVNIGDVNGDGKLDVVFGPHFSADTTPQGSEITVLPGNGDGTFGPPIETLTNLSVFLLGFGPAVLADVTNDGKADLLVIYQFRDGEGALDVYNGQSDGTMVRSYTASPTVLCSFNISGPVTGDFNRDGLLDFAADLCEGYQITLQGFGHFVPAGLAQVSPEVNVGGVIAGDLDGDGKLGLLFAQGNNLVFLRGDGQGGFTQPEAADPRPVFNAGTSPIPIAIADVNRDGKPDLIVLTDQGIAVLMNDSPPTLRERMHRPHGG